MADLKSLGKSVMDMFSVSGGAKVNQNQQQPGPAGMRQANMGSEGEPPKAPGAGGKSGNDNSGGDLSGSEPKSPLADFDKLWENPTPDPKAQKPLTVDDYLTFDPKKLSEITAQLDFAKDLDPEVVKKAQNGDPNAFAAAMNHAARSSFAQALHAMSGVARQALKKQQEVLLAQMPGEVRKLSTRQELAKNPLYSHPATQPLIQSLEAQLRRKHPDATPTQITEHVSKYIDGIVQLARGEGDSTKKPSGPSGSDDIDWMADFAEVEEPQH